MEYIIYDFTSNIVKKYFDSNILEYENNMNYVIVNKNDILTHPIGCYIEYDIDFINSNIDNSNIDPSTIITPKKFVYNKDYILNNKDNIIESIRTKRDNLLKITDIFLLDDYDFDYKTELKEYRKYLRNIPNEIERVGLLEYYNVKNKKLNLIDNFKYTDLSKYIKK